MSTHFSLKSLFSKNPLMEEEAKRWDHHTLHKNLNEESQAITIIETLEEDEPLQLCFVEKAKPFDYEHWFITIKNYVLDFYPNQDCSTYETFYGVKERPTIQQYHDPNQTKVFSNKCWGPEMKYRFKQVLGMTNYSHCLRNSEQVASYVVTGFWFSKQMTKDGLLYRRFGRALAKYKKLQFVNTLPIDILSVTPTRIYSFTTQHFRAEKLVHYLESEMNTHNILIVGPTGSGKSHLINVMFNTLVCATNVGHSSVTANMCFVVGKGDIQNRATRETVTRDVIVADTSGLDDVLYNEKVIFNLIKEKTASNFRELDLVLVVFSAARLTQQWVKNIRKLMTWLDYEHNYRRVYFIATHSEHLDSKETKTMAQSAKQILGIKDSDFLLYTSFPPEDSLNGKTELKCRKSWDALRRIVSNNPHITRIAIEPNGSTCKIQ